MAAKAEGLLTKLARFRKIIKDNGGIRGSLYTLYRTDELKTGDLVGEDKFGNKYYENNAHFYGRNRWVIYAPHYNMDYDGSQIPAEWHRWMHYITDKPPTVEPPVQRKWLEEHTENLSGTAKEYVPYSTTRPKIEAWQPPKAK